MFIWTISDAIGVLGLAAMALFAVVYTVGYYGKRAAYAIKRAFKR